MPGIYKGVGNRNLFIQRKNVIIKSTEGSLKTIIDCGGNSIASVKDNAQLFLDGLTIQNANKSFGTKYQRSGLVDIKNGSYLEAQNCIFLRNEITAGSAANTSIIHISSDSQADITNCLFYRNSNKAGSSSSVLEEEEEES